MATSNHSQLQTVTAPAIGMQLVQVEASTVPGEIEAGDLLRINFDQHTFTRDGYYILGLGEWTGVRRFADTLDGPRVLDVDDEWRPLPSRAQILGYVDMVYTARRVDLQSAKGVRHG